MRPGWVGVCGLKDQVVVAKGVWFPHAWGFSGVSVPHCCHDSGASVAFCVLGVLAKFFFSFLFLAFWLVGLGLACVESVVI